MHRLPNAAGQSRVLLILPGNTFDVTLAPALSEAAACRFDRPIVDRGYGSNTIHAAAQPYAPMLPSTSTVAGL